MIGGITVNINGTDYIVPPANLKSVKGWLKAQKDFKPGTLEYMTHMSEFVLAVFQRNYPEMTQDQLDEMLDGGLLNRVMLAVAEAGGLKPGEVRMETPAET